jgi:trehalose synthase
MAHSRGRRSVISMRPTVVPIAPRSPARWRPVLGEERYARLLDTIDRSGELLRGRAVWSVNSTAQGGGVAELLRSLIAYARGAGIDARWAVIEGDPDFFTVTKRIHNRLHGNVGDYGPLSHQERSAYERTLAANADALIELMRPGDVALLHDPQTAGLTDALREAGIRVIWRCHVGIDQPNDFAREAWDFLRPYVTHAEGYVFSRHAFVWEDLDPERITIIAPSIDPYSAKNQDIDPEVGKAILATAGLADGGPAVAPVFTRDDGTTGRVDRAAELVEEAPLPGDERLLCQVSRWDRLKDPAGVLEAFEHHVLPHVDCHLVLAGPSVADVTDDPEGAEVLAELTAAWEGLHTAVRPRVHLASLPMDDAEENAAMVNALQQRSTVVAQKSLAEGFGLTVAEAMWKSRPVVASQVGGIQDQIVDGETGFLVPPRDLAAFGERVVRVMRDPKLAVRLGNAARDRVVGEFLGPRHLTQYVDLLDRIVAGPTQPRAAA